MDNDREISRLILEVIPSTMRTLRQEFRLAVKDELTVPQLRVLSHLNRGVSTASELAEIQGVSLPAISRMVDSLSERHLVRREIRDHDKRQAKLFLTPQGKELHHRSRRAAQNKLILRLNRLDDESQHRLREGLEVLASLFAEFGPEA
jgi:DNA-binding MarR family transcriptional regulator